VVTPAVAAAYAECLRLAQSHYENFPVASFLMPKAARPHVVAIYAFARIADDFADEGTRPPAERLALLDDWERRLDEAAEGRVSTSGNAQHDAVFVALAATLRHAGAEAPALHQSAPAVLHVDGAPGFQPRGSMHALLADLLSAFRQDVTTTRYDTWEEVLDYCRRSANPIGRLMLLGTGNAGPAANAKSDAVCTALQLTNFWQDLAVDWPRGRLYVPLDIVRTHGAELADLDKGVLTPQWRDVMRDVGTRTRQLFDAGRGVADHVPGRLRLELRATWLGGTRILDRLAEADYDVFQQRPTLTRRDAPGILMDAVTWRARS
jgi:squalene synthase HpnC